MEDIYRMNSEDIVKLLWAFKNGKELEYKDIDKWKLSKAETLSELLYNIIECGTFYRIKK